MASIRKRGGKWQAQIRRKGFAPTTRTFHRKGDAIEWTRHMEALERFPIICGHSRQQRSSFRIPLV